MTLIWYQIWSGTIHFLKIDAIVGSNGAAPFAGADTFGLCAQRTTTKSFNGAAPVSARKRRPSACAERYWSPSASGPAESEPEGRLASRGGNPRWHFGGWTCCSGWIRPVGTALALRWRSYVLNPSCGGGRARGIFRTPEAQRETGIDVGALAAVLAPLGQRLAHGRFRTAIAINGVSAAWYGNRRYGRRPAPMGLRRGFKGLTKDG
jgi:hypothetical protein